MNAEEARNLSISQKLKGDKKQYDEVQSKIKEAVEKGYMYCYFYDSLIPNVENALKNEGFEISNEFHRNEVTVTISWLKT